MAKGTRDTDPPDLEVDRTRWQEASIFAQRNWLGALVLVLVLLTLGGVLKLIGDNQDTLQKQCDRGNVTRPAQIKTYLHIAQGNRDRAAAWVGIGELFPPTKPVAEQQRKANLAEANRLERDADALAAAQKSVSLHPNAPHPQKRAIVDCAGQFG